MRKFLSALLIAALLLVPAFAVPLTASSATYGGDCGRAHVYFWSGWNQTGSVVKYCWYGIGGGDANMVKNSTGPDLGPLWNGTYAYDFDASDIRSGIAGVTFYNNPSDALVSNLCVYYDTNFGTPMTRFYAGGNYNFQTEPHSMRWTTATSIGGC